ncbi:MAG: phosphate-starvation-inducible PsiE family protein [Methylovulum sp.]|jgi:phosphate starvation-inducible membrane PsiE|nr:phosphate-starvation-inducible PsiE family protein [Methylovulum sp.]
MEHQRLSVIRENLKAWIDELGSFFIDIFHYLALFIIGASTLWSAIGTFSGMVITQHASLGDILLLFIYLELGAMVGIYFQTNAMPVRCLIYIAITALARFLIADIQIHHEAGMNILLISGSILLLAIATRFMGKAN